MVNGHHPNEGLHVLRSHPRAWRVPLALHCQEPPLRISAGGVRRQVARLSDVRHLLVSEVAEQVTNGEFELLRAEREHVHQVPHAEPAPCLLSPQGLIDKPQNQAEEGNRQHSKSVEYGLHKHEQQEQNDPRCD
jgi:hypothetical protein